ncbi:MAG: hypothetical protein M1339_00275, partial [Bacteroidetes bacterium]|nr:hypothetical protein [Bacteroidota bacterium]
MKKSQILIVFPSIRFALIMGKAAAKEEDRGAIKLSEPYRWELHKTLGVPVPRLFKTLASSSWLSMGPAPTSTPYWNNVAGRMTSIAVDPTDSLVVYAAAAGGGLWKTTDGGSSWTPLTDNFSRLASGAVAVDPNNPSVIYYGTGELNFNIDGYPGTGFLYKSTDGGDSWTQLAMPQNGGLYYTSQIVVAPSNSNYVYASGFWDVYRSTDAGASWTELDLTDGAVDDIVVSPTNANIIYASYGSGFSGDSTNYGIFESTDAGNTWTKLTNGLPSSGQIFRISLAIAPSNPQVLYAAINGNRPTGRSQDTNRVYISQNGGSSWSVLPSVTSTSDFGGGQGWYNNVIAVDPNNPKTVYLGGVDFWKSTDSGNTWSPMTNGYGLYKTGQTTVHVDQHAIAFAKGSSTTFYIGNDGGVWKTTNAGASFTDCNSNLQTIQFYDITASPANQNLTIGGTQDNGTEMNAQPSTTWNLIFGGDGGYVMIDPSNPNIVYTEYVNGEIQKSVNGGQTFNEITSSSNIGSGYWLTPYVMDPVNNNLLYTATDKVYESTNGGTNWASISPVLNPNLPSSSNQVTTMSISPVEGNVLYAGISGYRGAADSAYLYVSTSSGANWTNITGNLPPGTNFCQVTADPTHKGEAYLAVLTYANSLQSPHVLRTTDYGQTWVGLDSSGNGFANVPTKVIVVDSLNGYIYAGTYAGVFESTDNGASWSQFGTGLPNAVVDGIAIQYSSNLLRIGTHGRGAWQIGVLTGIAEPANTPTSFA